MSEAALGVLLWLLLGMSALPVLTALVLLRHVNSPVLGLKERARLAQVLGLLGVIVGAAAMNRLFNLGWPNDVIGMILAAGLLLVDIACGFWLWDYYAGRFSNDH